MGNSTVSFQPIGGYITNPNIYVRNTMKPDPDGVLSEPVFGPINSFKCSCGRLKSKLLDKDKVCLKCGVACKSNNLRLKTSGKIKMVFPYIKPTKTNEIIKIIGKDNKQLLDPVQADASKALSRYLTIKLDESEIKIITNLKKVDTSKWVSIPFRITGLYSLIFVLKFCAEILDIEIIKPIFDNIWTTNKLTVLPPDVRPIFRDLKRPNSLIRVEVNDHYISLLNLNKRYEILAPSVVTDEENWREQIIFNLKNGLMTEEIVDNMSLEYDRIAALYQFYVNEVYRWGFTTLSGKKGLIRGSILSRTIEFSARTVITINPKLQAYDVNISRKILWKLWMPYFLNWLCVLTKQMKFDVAFEKVVTTDYEDNVKLFDKFLKAFCKDTKKEDNRRLLFLNRQPTLYSHGVPAVRASPCEELLSNVIEVGPTFVSPLNADFDGYKCCRH